MKAAINGNSNLDISHFVIYFFAVLLIVLSLMFLGEGLQHFQEWHRVRNWVSVPAELNYAEVFSGYSGQRHTYTLRVNYTYHYQDQEYTGKRVSQKAPEAVTEWHNRPIPPDVSRAPYWMVELENSAKNKKKIQVWANPDKPSESVIYRSIKLKDVIIESTVPVFLLAALGIGLIRLGRWVQKNKNNPSAFESEAVKKNVARIKISFKFLLYFIIIVWIIYPLLKLLLSFLVDS